MMRYACLAKWNIELRDFGLTKNEELDVLTKCGLEVTSKINTLNSTTILTMMMLVDDPEDVANQDIRDGIASMLGRLSSTFKVTSTVKKIFATVVSHIKNNEPYDTVFTDYPFYNLDEDSTFMREAKKEFMGNVTRYIMGMVKDNGYNYSYEPHKTATPFTPAPKVIEDRTNKLKNIRTAEKIVVYKDTNWKVNYTVSMDADETYVHTIDVCDYNDFDNKSTVTVKTDSHFIKDLDKTIKSAIEELQQGLWTIDKFEKWSGDLSG
jgi:hypothetical protein